MSFEVTGTLIEKYNTTEVSSKFKKREFVLERTENSNNYESTDYIKFQLTQDKCSILDSFNIGESLKVSFNLRGRKWEKDGNISYFTNLDAWKIEKVSSSSSTSKPANFPQEDIPMPGSEDFTTKEDFDDLPF